MANITLKDINGNNIYPEVDASTLSGTITENNKKFVIPADITNVDSKHWKIYTVTGDFSGLSEKPPTTTDNDS